MYTTHNLRFLRISKRKVLQLYLRLTKDETQWFSDYIFQQILAVLRPLIESRLVQFESGSISLKKLNKATSRSARDTVGVGNIGVTSNTSIGSSKNNGYFDSAQLHLGDQIHDYLEDAGVLMEATMANGGSSNSSMKYGGEKNLIQYRVRYGFREATNSERTGGLLFKDKQVGFFSPSTSATENNEVQKTTNVGNVAVLVEEDADGSLTVNSFPRDTSVVVDDNDNNNDRRNDDIEVLDKEPESIRTGSKRKRSAPKGKETVRSSSRGEKSQSLQPQLRVEEDEDLKDLKPQLKVSYSPLTLYSKVLYVSLHVEPVPMMDSFISNPSAASTSTSTPVGGDNESSRGVLDKLQDEAIDDDDDDNLLPDEIFNDGMW